MAAHTQPLTARTIIGTPVSLGTAANGAVGAGQATLAVAISSNIVAGDLVVVVVSLGTNSASTAASMTDGTNTYTRADTTGLFGATSELSLWYVSNAAAVSSGTSITCTFNTSTTGAGNSSMIGAVRVPTMPVSNVDKVAHNSNAGASTVTATTAAIGFLPEIAFGVTYMFVNIGYSGAPGFTNMLNFSDGANTRTTLDYQILNSSGTVAYTPSTGAATTRMGAIVSTFRSY